MTKYADIYQRFLSLSHSIDEFSYFPLLKPEERCLIRHLNIYWIKKEEITVLKAMNAVKNMSNATTFRYLKSLRQKGYVRLETDDKDNRKFGWFFIS